mgnify:CR=1 FL=1
MFNNKTNMQYNKHHTKHGEKQSGNEKKHKAYILK